MFNTGQNAQNNTALVRAQVDAGMWVGNHSWSHPHPPQMSSSQILSQLQQTQTVLRPATGTTPKLCRPPYGETNATLNSASPRSSGTSTLRTGTAPGAGEPDRPSAATPKSGHDSGE